MRLVAALGGNALLRRGEPMTAERQRANVRRAVRPLSQLILAGHDVVITHGNGPQVGLLALQAQAGPPDGDYPLDVLGAESEGMIGYLIEQELRNVLPAGSMIATLLTQVLVDRYDPAFASPTKPIGPIYSQDVAQRLARERNWTIVADESGWRRAVASPEPREILEARVIEYLVDGGAIVVCAGGGGIPVLETDNGALVGAEAVIDKDLASSLLAQFIAADWLLLLTDVDAVYRDWGKSTARPINALSPRSIDLEPFAEGSMRPKVDAAARFVSNRGKTATIGHVADVAEMLKGSAGTVLTSEK
ncbi:MAG: carbamate kinase [Hyphomicrobiaceae bacterium]